MVFYGSVWFSMSKWLMTWMIRGTPSYYETAISRSYQVMVIKNASFSWRFPWIQPGRSHDRCAHGRDRRDRGILWLFRRGTAGSIPKAHVKQNRNVTHTCIRNAIYIIVICDMSILLMYLFCFIAHKLSISIWSCHQLALGLGWTSGIAMDREIPIHIKYSYLYGGFSSHTGTHSYHPLY